MTAASASIRRDRVGEVVLDNGRRAGETEGPRGWPVAALLVGVGLGLALFALGVVWGGRIFTRRAPELLAFTLRQ